MQDTEQILIQLEILNVVDHLFLDPLKTNALNKKYSKSYHIIFNIIFRLTYFLYIRKTIKHIKEIENSTNII